MSNLKIFTLIFFILSLVFINSQESSSEVDDTIKSSQPNENKKENIEKEDTDWDKPFDEIRGYRIRSEEEINYLLKISDLTFVRFIYRKSSPKSRKIAKILKHINEKLEGLGGIIQIDCDIFIPQESALCKDNPYMIDSYPRLKLLIPPEKRYNPFTGETDVHYEFPFKDENYTEDGIYKYIVSNMPYYTYKLNEDNANSFLNTELFNKVIFFTNKKQPSMIIKGLTNYFYDRILFAEVEESEKELRERFNVNTFPTVLIYKVFDHKRLLDEHETIKYEGLTKIADLIEFIEPHCIKEKRYVSENRFIYEEDLRDVTSNIDFKEININNYTDYFNKYHDRNIMVYFNTQDNMKHIYKQILVKNHGFFLTVFFNCDDERKFCLEKFNVKKFPSLMFFPPGNTLEERINFHTYFPIGKNYEQKEFINKIYEILPSNVKISSNMDLPYLVQEAKFDLKYLIVDMYLIDEVNKQNLSYDLLSRDPELMKHFMFSKLEEPEHNILNLYKIKSPKGYQIFILKPDSTKVITINRSNNFKTMKSILINIINDKLSVKRKRSFTSQSITKIENNADLKKKCLDHQYCLITFFDTTNEENNIKLYDDGMTKIEYLQRNPTYENVKFNWIDLGCHKKFFDNFGLKDIPGIIFIYNWRNRYSIFKGIWEHFILNEFVERVLSDRYTAEDLDKEWLQLSQECDEKIEEIKTENIENTEKIIKDDL